MKRTLIALSLALCGVASAQTVIDHGGTYVNKNYQSAVQGTPALLITTTEPVIIVNSWFVADICLIACTGANVTLDSCEADHGHDFKKSPVFIVPAPKRLNLIDVRTSANNQELIISNKVP